MFIEIDNIKRMAKPEILSGKSLQTAGERESMTMTKREISD